MKKSLITGFIGIALTWFALPSPSAKAADGGETAGKIKTFAVKGVSFNMVYCPPGTFEMGSTKEQQDDALAKKAWPSAVKCETLHKVTLTKGYWMLDTQVNQELYKAVTGSLPEMIANPDPQKIVPIRAEDSLPDHKTDKRLFVFPGDKIPVHMVNFEDATNFLKTLSKYQGVNFRLPTEAEWEYAARAGTHTIFPNGDTLDGKQANYNYGRDAHHRIINGKSYNPNAWGIYDIPGQLHEWCLDRCTREFSPDGKTPITMVVTDTYVDGIVDPFCKVGDDKHYRVCRNEGFEFGAIFCRVAFREVFAERTRIPNVGFRFVMADPIDDTPTAAAAPPNK
jgi:formylglycine-generating enzyme required for sulfatase activity